MKSDVIVVGAELDGQVAALRLLERGHRVRLFARGAGSLHYAPGGVHLLGYAPGKDDKPLAEPFESMSALGADHPYRLLGSERIKAALGWFLSLARSLGEELREGEENHMTVTPAGLRLPAYATDPGQASFADLQGKAVVLVRFRGHRDFPVGLLARGLEEVALSVQSLEVDPPGERADSLAMARALDAPATASAFFQHLARCLPGGTDVVLLPAVLGLRRHGAVLAAARSCGLTCLEVPTLPPSVAGLRLSQALWRRLGSEGAALHQGIMAAKGERGRDGRLSVLRDDRGGSFAADAFVLASGGVLMGGLEVDSRGRVSEPAFGLAVWQSAPLGAPVPDALDALHRTGVEVDDNLRPREAASDARDRIFVTGATLAHWNPAEEISAEGVAIASGWAAAEAVHRELEQR